MSTLPLDSIVIGERVRKDMGDIAGLAESIKKHGLMHPVVVKSDKTLVAGHRRIEAVKVLGWSEVPVTQIDVADLLSAERDENEQRKGFSPTEAVEIGRMIEEQERPKAAARLAEGRARGGRSRQAQARGEVVGTKPTSRPRQGVREIASAAVGMDAKTYVKAKEVVAAAESNPDRFGDLPALMDETGDVKNTHLELQRRTASKNHKPRHAIHTKTHHPQADKIAERTVRMLEGVCLGLSGLDVKQLDPAQIAAWATSLDKSITTLKRFHKEMKSCQQQ